ncbi:MAG: hypothetical protein ACK4UN_04855 [Limisphaerales bacterium]
MKMPTTSAAGRSRTGAKASNRKTTLTRSLKAGTPASKKAVRKKATPAKGRAATAKGASKATGAQVKGSARTTTNHDKIQQWAESRKGTPATVKVTQGKNEAGILRIDFPGYRGKTSLQKISWEKWFKKFDQSKLAFLYQDKTKDGKQSRFFKLVKK